MFFSLCGIADVWFSYFSSHWEVLMFKKYSLANRSNHWYFRCEIVLFKPRLSLKTHFLNFLSSKKIGSFGFVNYFLAVFIVVPYNSHGWGLDILPTNEHAFPIYPLKTVVVPVGVYHRHTNVIKLFINADVILKNELNNDMDWIPILSVGFISIEEGNLYKNVLLLF